LRKTKEKHNFIVDVLSNLSKKRKRTNDNNNKNNNNNFNSNDNVSEIIDEDDSNDIDEEDGYDEFARLNLDEFVSDTSYEDLYFKEFDAEYNCNHQLVKPNQYGVAYDTTGLRNP
jgi:hypothetical protein